MWHLHLYANKQKLAEGFAQWMYKDILTSEKDYHISLSGGSTPRKLFEVLAAHYADKIPWKRVHLWWGDERMVGPDHEDSNYGMTALHLLSGIDIPQTQVHRIRGEEDPEEEAIRYAREMEGHLDQRSGKPIFDLMILGMGEDGHTASIFPGNLEQFQTEQSTFVATHPESGQLRISLTGPIINHSRQIAFLVAGSSKFPKIKEILGDQDASAYPAAHVDAKEGELHWFLDEGAYRG